MSDENRLMLMEVLYANTDYDRDGVADIAALADALLPLLAEAEARGVERGRAEVRARVKALADSPDGEGVRVGRIRAALAEERP